MGGEAMTKTVPLLGIVVLLYLISLTQSERAFAKTAGENLSIDNNYLTCMQHYKFDSVLAKYAEWFCEHPPWESNPTLFQNERQQVSQDSLSLRGSDYELQEGKPRESEFERMINICVREVKNELPFSSIDAYVENEYVVNTFGTAEGRFKFKKCMAKRGLPLTDSSDEIR
jgi:hypothetical protein